VGVGARLERLAAETVLSHAKRAMFGMCCPLIMLTLPLEIFVSVKP